MSTQVLRYLQQENQRLMEENRLLREEVMALRDYLKGLRSLQRAAETITAEEDPVALLEKILYSALTVIDAADGSVLLLDREANELYFAVVHGRVADELRGRRMPADAGIAGWVAANKESQIVNNVRADRRHYSRFDETYHFQTQALLCVPMVSRGKVLGVIQVLNKFNQQDFSEADEDLLSTLAYIAATAIDLLEGELASPALETSE